MLELIEDSLARLLDDGANAVDAADARALIARLNDAGMLDLLVAVGDEAPPLPWPDAARLFMLLGEKAPDAPVADAILARAIAAACAAELPPFTVLAAGTVRLSLDTTGPQPTVTGEIDGVPWGDCAEAAVAVIGDPSAAKPADQGPSIVALARTAASAVRDNGVAIEPRSTWTFEAAQPLAVIDCAAGIEPALMASAMRAAQIAGAMRAAREMTIGYANDREQFGKPIGRQQAIQHRIAVMAEHSALVGAAAMLAWAGNTPPSSPERVATAKGLASEYAAEVAAAAHAVHGAIGFTEEYSLSRLTRRLWQWRSEHGSAASCYAALGARTLAEPQRGIWNRVIETTR